MPGRLRRSRNLGDDRGAVLPSPVVILSVLAVVFAAVAFVVTLGSEPEERAIDTASADSAEAAEEPTAPETEEEVEEVDEEPPPPPPVTRGDIAVVVFNNTNTRGLAGKVSTRVEEMGWRVVGADNWYGTIPATTVYHPQGMKRAANQLALDLGVERVMPTVDSMSSERLTLILTGELD